MVDNIEKNKVKVYINNLGKESERNEIIEGKITIESQKKKKKIIVISSIIVVLAIIVTLIILFAKPIKPNTPSIISSPPSPSPPSSNTPSTPISNTKKKLNGEPGYSFKTEIGQFNRIYINQKYIETTLRNGKNITIFLDRKNIYNIYVISETDPEESKKHLYSKMYTCAISIESECTSNTEENCKTRTILDLIKETTPKYAKIRHLQNNENLNEIPIPLCIFNITDHNAITSITCPKSLPERKIKEIVLDLYFFRPPGVERVEKEKNNITITIQDLDNGNKIIREINGGRCDDESGFFSFCSTDFNATKDSENNLLSYDELCYTNITEDENNYYIKNKITHLIDLTIKNDTSKAKLYKEKLDILLEQIKPNMKYYEQVSDKQFEDIYNITVNGNLPKKNKRQLNDKEEEKQFINKDKIFEFIDYGGAIIALTLEDDSSLNTKSFKANSYLNFNEDPSQEKILVNNNQQSILTELLDRLIILSKIGNNMANELYQNIKNSLEKIIEEISLKISYLNNLLDYQNITKIFDSSLNLDDIEKLPYEITGESTSLYNKMNSLLTELNSYEIKEKFNIINKNINNFISESYNLVYKIYNNLNDLGNSMNSEGNKLTEISMYYLKKNNSKYMNVVLQAQEILENYYKNEAKLIKVNISSIIEDFENNLSKSSEDEKNMIIELYQKLENKTFFIENITDKLCQKTIEYLSNSTIILKNISNRIKELINKELEFNLKGEYFLSESDININNITFSGSIEKAKEIADKLDKDQFIDKTFDEIMGFFRQIFADILMSMGQDKIVQFNLKEETLNNSLFKKTEKNNIQNKFNSFSLRTINEIKNENEKYKESINSTIKNFTKENQKELNSLISDLYILFSNETFIELGKLYNSSFFNYIKDLNNNIKSNENLAKYYFDDMKNVVQDTNYIITLLQSFQQDTIHIPKSIGSYDFQYFIDTIQEKKITQAYNLKYNTFKANINYTKNYINNQLHLDLINIYKDPIVKIRKALQSIKNNKLSEKYPDLQEIGFTEHKQIIDILFNRFDTFFSDDIYNNYYIDYINEYKYSENPNIDRISNYIEESNNIISSGAVVSDYAYDYCVNFKREKYYMCSNRQWKCRDYSDDYCVPVSQNASNYLNLKDISINFENYLLDFNNKFNEFVNLIYEKIDIYNSKINKLKYNLLDIENEIMNKNNIIDYIFSFKDQLNEILKKDFGDKLIISSYEYFKNETEQKIGRILNKSTNYWLSSYDELEEKLKENKNNINTSISEFSTMAFLYNTIINQNISKSFYDSIIIHQKNEFNYTISYYYNYLLRLANSTHNYLINRVLINQNSLNFIIEKRINLINELFNSLMENITLEEKEALSIEKQLKVLNVNENNFFKVNNIFEDNLMFSTEYLNQKFSNIKKIKNNLKSDQYSITARFYLENDLCGDLINNLYKVIDGGKFIELNKDIFKEIIINNNWIFNFDEFTNELEVKLYSLEKEIEEEFQIHKKQYSNILEEVLNLFFTKDGIINKINELYNEGMKSFNNNMKNDILNLLNEILNTIFQHLSNEEKRVGNTQISIDRNTTLINNTILKYKQEILNKINNTIILVAEDYYQNINKKFYEEYINPCLDKYFKDLKDPITYPEYKLLNSSFNFNDIINNILINHQEEYKSITKKQIIFKHKLKLNEIYNIFNLEEIKKIIDNKIDSQHKNLVSVIDQKGVNNAGYNQYNLNSQIIGDINQTIESKMKEIESIVNSTKGENYQIEIKNWPDPNDFDFTIINDIDIKVNIIDDKIKNDFKKFIESEYKYENDSINSLLEEVIKNNFNNLLSYLIPSFGKKFFERIIKYNENFKIITLYDNLKYTITTTLSYYITILSLNSISALPIDLKINLYNLNNLDLIVKNYNKEILKKVDDKINDFIAYFQNYILTEYSKTFNEFYIDQKFNQKILSLIEPKVQQVNSYLMKNLQNYLNFYLKEPFIKTYKNVMNEKTNEMIIFANNQKELLRQNIFNKLTIKSEDILEEINENVNKTEKAINEYKAHYQNFIFNQEFIQYLNTFYENNIHQKFSNLITLINNAKSNNKNIALNNLMINSEKYENLFILNEFINATNNIHSFFEEEYINNITENIEKYDASNYKENFREKKREYKKNNLRFLTGNETQKDIEDFYYGKIANKALGKIFQKLLKASNLLKSTIDGGNEFDKLDEKINNFEKDLNKDYERSLNIINYKYKNGIFDDDLFNIFKERLINLFNNTKDYYSQIYENYNNIRDYLNESIYNIDKSLIECFNVTNNTFNEEYEEIKNEFIPMAINISSNKNVFNHYNFPFNNSITGEISYDININSQKKAYFSLNIEFEGIEDNQVTAKIINLSGPKDMNIEIISGTSTCGDIKKILTSNFQEANSTMIITYNSESTNINITNILNIKEYTYNIKTYRRDIIKAEDEFIEVNGIIINIGSLGEDECKDILEDDDKTLIKERKNSTTILI